MRSAKVWCAWLVVVGLSVALADREHWRHRDSGESCKAKNDDDDECGDRGENKVEVDIDLVKVVDRLQREIESLKIQVRIFKSVLVFFRSLTQIPEVL